MMGARGTKKKNRAVNQLEGNPSRRPLDRASVAGDEAQQERPVDGALGASPPLPDQLKKMPRAAELWRAVSKQLVARQLLSDADLPALLVLCMTWQSYLDAVEIASDPDQAYPTSEKGGVYAHPAVYQVSSAGATLDKLWRKFGLTPIDRQELGVVLKTKADGGTLGEFAKSKPH